MGVLTVSEYRSLMYPQARKTIPALDTLIAAGFGDNPLTICCGEMPDNAEGLVGESRRKGGIVRAVTEMGWRLGDCHAVQIWGGGKPGHYHWAVAGPKPEQIGEEPMHPRVKVLPVTVKEAPVLPNTEASVLPNTEAEDTKDDASLTAVVRRQIAAHEKRSELYTQAMQVSSAVFYALRTFRELVLLADDVARNDLPSVTGLYAMEAFLRKRILEAPEYGRLADCTNYGVAALKATLAIADWEAKE